MSDKYALVTGAAGFIGSAITKSLIESGRKVVAIDCFLPNLYPASLKRDRWDQLKHKYANSLTMFEFDLRKDSFEILDAFEIDTVFNQAAMPGLIDNWSNSQIYYECNLIALNRLLEFVRHLDLKSFIHASTSSVYGRTAIGGEDSPTKPTSPYGVSKFAAERLLFAYQDLFSIPVVVLRYFSVYGPGQRPDMAYAKLISAAKKDKEFVIFGDGSQIRSNTYIDDIVSATLLAESPHARGHIFNVCGDEKNSLLEVIRKIEKITGKSIKIRRETGRRGDQVETAGVNQKIKSLLFWRPEVDFDTGIRRQIECQSD